MFPSADVFRSEMKNFLPHRFRRAIYSLGAMLLGITSLRADNSPLPGLPVVTFRGQNYLTRTVDPQKEDLQLFWKDDQGNLLRDFATLEKFVSGKGEKLVFAANAGMFDPASKPVGLLVQNGVETTPLNLDDGTGNFFMKPNGVFLINSKHEALVVASGNYAALLSPALWATQSGPLLVHGGDIHPDFNPNSQSRKMRSGVGVTKEGEAIFALSQAPVTFYEFASLFRTKLKCPNALFLDGDISAFYVPGAKDASAPHLYGPIFGIVEKAGP